MISKNPPMYESGADSAVIDLENKIHKITFKKGGVLNVGREGEHYTLPVIILTLSKFLKLNHFKP